MIVRDIAPAIAVRVGPNQQMGIHASDQRGSGAARQQHTRRQRRPASPPSLHCGIASATSRNPPAQKKKVRARADSNPRGAQKEKQSRTLPTPPQLLIERGRWSECSHSAVLGVLEAEEDRNVVEMVVVGEEGSVCDGAGVSGDGEHHTQEEIRASKRAAAPSIRFIIIISSSAAAALLAAGCRCASAAHRRAPRTVALLLLSLALLCSAF